MIRHNIPGARKRRDRRHGPRKPTGWVLVRDITGRNRRWVHPDGRWWRREFGSRHYWTNERHEMRWGPGGAHPARFSSPVPF